MLFRVAPVIVTVDWPVVPPKLADTLTVPTAIPVATPDELKDTTDELEDVQLTAEVRSMVLPSEYVP